MYQSKPGQIYFHPVIFFRTRSGTQKKKKKKRACKTKEGRIQFKNNYLSRTCSFYCKCISIETFSNEVVVDSGASYFRRIGLRIFRRSCWDHGTLIKINFSTDVLIRTPRKFSERIYLIMTPQIYVWYLVALVVEILNGESW